MSCNGPNCVELYIGEDNLLVWDGMINNATGLYVNDATVTFRLAEMDNTEVATGSLSYVVASNGKYQGVLDKLVALELGVQYILTMTAVSGSVDGFRRLRAVAKYHGGE